MRVTALSFLVFTAFADARAQEPVDPPTGGLVLNDAIGVHLSRTQVFDAALDAWNWTFGQQPGAHLDVQDRATGVIEGRARVNFRSKDLTCREETMGTISYHVVIRTENGNCAVQVGRIMHTGNRNATRGGLDIGTIYAEDGQVARASTIGLKRTRSLHQEIREIVSAKITELMRAFAARMRHAGEP